MMSFPQEPFRHPFKEPFSTARRDFGEETLRLVASLPAPEGLADRVQTGLRTAPRTGTIVPWPTSFRPAAGLMRTAAAAAIVCVVAGGGWRIYSHTPAATPHLLVMPHSPAVSAGFGAANAKHVPETLNGPVLIQHPVPQPEAIKALVGPQAVPVTPLKKKKKAAHTLVAPVH